MTWYEILFRLGVALIIGLIIGFEREHHHRPAGMKTHIMVCMGAAIISIIQILISEETIAKIAEDPSLSEALKVDMGRLGAQVVSGIGFLGAGTILQYRGSIKGLTSAATLWLTACIGLAAGMGYYFLAIGAFVIVMVVLVSLRVLQSREFRRSEVVFDIDIQDKKTAVDSIEYYCNNHGIKISDITVEKSGKGDANEIYHCFCKMKLPRAFSPDNVIKDLIREEGIVHIAEFSE